MILSMSLWNSTIGYGSVKPKIEYLTDEQNARLERIRVTRALWRGQHRQVFLEEGRTQANFPRLRVQGIEIQPYLTVNVLRLITTTITDLLLGEEPSLQVAEELGQESISELVRRSDLHSVLYQAVSQASWAAESMVEIVRWDGQVYVQNVRPDDIFPIGPRNPDGQYSAYTRFATAAAGNKTYLLETTFTPGLISRKCFELSEGTRKGPAVDLANWPVKRADGSALVPEEPTGMDWNTIVWLPNELDEGVPTCDYDGLIELQDELNAKQTQIFRVVAKHADPKLAAPAAARDEQGNLPASHEVFFFHSKEEIPQYITWNAELAAAMQDRDFTLNALCMASELSPILLGIKQGATPDAARKLRLEATKSLARAKRKAAYVKAFISTVLDTVLRMENGANAVQVAMGESSVELRDGLPVDELDEAQALSLLTGGKAVMSIERAVSRQITDPDAAAEEVARIKAQTAASVPPIFGDATAGQDSGTHGQGGQDGESMQQFMEQNNMPVNGSPAQTRTPPVGGGATNG